jgi:hypothetical protein
LLFALSRSLRIRSGVGVSVLIRQPCGFEGLRAILEIILPDHQAAAKGEELIVRFADGYSATHSLPAHLGRDEKAVSQVEQFLRVEPDVLEALEQALPNLHVADMPVVERIEVELPRLAGAVLDARIKAGEDDIEVPAIRRRVSLPNNTHKHHSAQPRVPRQSRPPGKQQTGERREADQDPFIQGPVLPCCLAYGRESNTLQGFGLQMRQRVAVSLKAVFRCAFGVCRECSFRVRVSHKPLLSAPGWTIHEWDKTS